MHFACINDAGIFQSFDLGILKQGFPLQHIVNEDRPTTPPIRK
jgi:hypothetical protein